MALIRRMCGSGMTDHNMHCVLNVFFVFWNAHRFGNSMFSSVLFCHLVFFCHRAVSLCLFPSMMSLSLLYTALGAVKFVHNLVVFLYSMLCLQKQIQEWQIPRLPILGTVLVLERLKARLCTQFDCEFFFRAPLKPPDTPTLRSYGFLRIQPGMATRCPCPNTYEKRSF